MHFLLLVAVLISVSHYFTVGKSKNHTFSCRHRYYLLRQKPLSVWNQFTMHQGSTKLRWCSRDRNHRDLDLVKTSRPTLHKKFRDRDSRLEIRDRGFKICGFLRNFSKNCHHFQV